MFTLGIILYYYSSNGFINPEHPPDALGQSVVYARGRNCCMNDVVFKVVFHIRTTFKVDLQEIKTLNENFTKRKDGRRKMEKIV